MNNVMIDLETLGTRPGSVIISIGAVYFDHTGLGPEFSVAIDIADAQREGLAIDAETVRWWLGQNEKAKEAFGFGGESLRTALRQFEKFITHEPISCKAPPRIWGNGASFDLSILAEAYARCGLDRPWRYSAERCHRTLAALYPYVGKREDQVAHIALDDARAQALHAADILAHAQTVFAFDEKAGRTAIAQLDTLAQALGIDPGSPEAHHHAVHRLLHLAARGKTAEVAP